MSSSSLFPQHCSTVPVLYELLKGEEEESRIWLRSEMNQIADPLIDSLFHGLIMSSSSSAVPQSRLTVPELCQQLDEENVEVRRVLRGEMDRLTNSLFERLTNKLRTNTDLNRSDDGEDRAQAGNLSDRVESPNPRSHQPSSHIAQPSTSTFNPVALQQHSNGNELELNTVEIIEIKEEVEDGEETRVIDIEALTQDNQSGAGESRSGETNQQMDCVKQKIKEEFDSEEEIEIKQEDEDETTNKEVKLEIKKEKKEDENEELDEPERSNIELITSDQTQNRDMSNASTSSNEPSNRNLTNLVGKEVNNNIQHQFDETNNTAEMIEQEDADGETELIDNNNTLNEPNCVTRVTQSGDLFSPWTSTGQDSNRTMNNEQATVHTQHNHNKRKQTQLQRTDKRAKVTLEDGEDGEEIVDEDGDETKVKVLYLNCTQLKCSVKLDSLNDLHNHLRTVHRLLPLQCFAMNCNLRFDDRKQIASHIKLYHSQSTQFLCPICHKEFDSQKKTYQHWYHYHLIGQFKCNLVSYCAEVTDTRIKMQTHQNTKHHSQSRHLHCTHVGCTASFAFKYNLKRHELTHLNSQPFHCIWPQCKIRTNRRSNLVTHIRMQHFGLPQSMKEQKAKNIVDQRDPNEYVRVVADE